MSKQSTSNRDLSNQLDELKGLLANQKRGQVITVDRQLQEMNNTLQRLLYATVVKHGISMLQGNGVIGTMQIPIMQPPASHNLQWEVAEDGRSIMVYVVQTDSPEEEDQATGTSEAEGDGGGETTALTTPASPPPDPGEDEPFLGSGDEFEDEIKVGMDD